VRERRTIDAELEHFRGHAVVLMIRVRVVDERQVVCARAVAVGISHGPLHVEQPRPAGRPHDASAMLHPGDLIARFDGATVDGRVVPYDQRWQHRNMVLFVLSAELGAASSPYLRALEDRLSELKPDAHMGKS
jgi:hypothetical protein